MDKIIIAAKSSVTGENLAGSQLGARFGRMDLSSKLCLLAVEQLAVDFSTFPAESVAVCLGAAAGSLATDLDFWQGRAAAGGPSPTLFAFTLPSAAIGEIAIRHRLTGPNFCMVGPDKILPEAADLLRRGEAEACVCVSCHVVTPALAEMLRCPPAARACAVFLRRGGKGLRELDENDRDMQSLCAAS